MPIGGVVISTRPEDCEELVRLLADFEMVDVHGSDEKGNIVAVLDTESSAEMERIIDKINDQQQVLSVGLTYLNTEDEMERISSGEQQGMPPGYRKPLTDET